MLEKKIMKFDSTVLRGDEQNNISMKVQLVKGIVCMAFTAIKVVNEIGSLAVKFSLEASLRKFS